MDSKIPSLPSEVLTMILRQTRRSDLGQCLLVSSSFKALAQPLLYRYVRFNDFGVSFPYAEHRAKYAYVSPSRMYKSEVTLQDVDHIEVHDHEYHHYHQCAFSGCLPINISSYCRALSVRLENPVHDFNVSSVHYLRLSTPHSATSNLDFPETDETFPPWMNPSDCHVLKDMFEHLIVDKLVLSNVPVAYNGVDPNLLSVATFKSIREIVVLFDAYSTNSDHAREVSDWVSYHTCSDGKRPCVPEYDTRVTIHDLVPLFPPNATEFTFVFWEPKPGTEVTTCCCNALKTRCSSSSASAPEVRHTWACTCSDRSGNQDFDLDTHQSCWQDRFQDRLAKAIAAHHANKVSIRKITIVNASAIVPDGSSRMETLRTISMGQATHDTWEERFRGKLKPHLLKVGEVEAEKVMNCLEFVYMKDWLATTEWEDVFSWGVVKPWLEFEPRTISTT